MEKSVEERVTDLEKRMAALEGQVQEQPKRKFTLEDSIHGVYKDTKPIETFKSQHL